MTPSRIQKTIASRLHPVVNETAADNVESVHSASSQLTSLSDRLRTSESVTLDACGIYQTAIEENLYQYYDPTTLVGASYRLATVKNGEVRPLSHITDFLDAERQALAKATRRLIEKTAIEYTPAAPTQYIPFLINELHSQNIIENVEEDTLDSLEKRAKDILAAGLMSDSHHFSGARPLGPAAGSLYAAALLSEEIDLTQSQVKEASTVSTVCIRKHYQNFLESYEESYSQA